ncbi:MAG TPA: protein kinase [Thermoanaerobaculia bacterium]
MQIAAGTRLGPYEIVSRIGAGGMGEVWRARDVRLDRPVAIKVLPPELANSAQLKLRFEREARAISQLNHPHICTLHDVGEDSGRSYLVMELLEGETLADRLSRGPLPLPDVIRYGTQIAEALDRAHRAGIVHRDLKPGNIMLTRSGAKLLDFGLAKTTGVAVEMNAPTVQKPLTQEGTILGTFQYMAPEQLEGAEADARTDIFALGAVLYEMVTGRRAFDGKTKTSLIAAIVGGQPLPIRDAQPLTPSILEHVIATCLQKDPERRWQSAHDVAAELQWIGEGAVPGEAAPRRRAWIWPAIAVAAALVAAAAVLVFGPRRAGDPLSFVITAPEGYALHEAVPSPDGKRIALGTSKDGEVTLWIRELGAVKPVPLLTNDEGSLLFWSPDSKTVGFFQEGRLLKMSQGDARPEQIARINGYGVSAAWGRQGVILFTPAWAEGLYRVPASGGEPVAVTRLDASRRESLHTSPVWLEDDERFLYLARTIAEEMNEIRAGSLDGKTQKTVAKADALIGMYRDHVLFVRNGAIYAQRFDDDELSLTGEPRRIVDDATYVESAAAAPAGVGRDGTLVYAPSSNHVIRYQFAWYDDQGRLLQKALEETSLNSFQLSRDETRLAGAKHDPKKGASNIHVYDLTRGVSNQLTSGLANATSAVWARDGSRLFYSSDSDGLYDIYEQTEDGTTPPRVVWKGVQDKYPSSVSPDGSSLLVTLYSPKTDRDLWIVPLNGGAPRPWIAAAGVDDGAVFSPDGKWVAYTSNRSGRSETYVAAFPDGRSVRVSTAGGEVPSWEHDGSRVIFMAADRTLYAASVRPNGKTAEIGKPVPLFQPPPTMSSCLRSTTTNRFLCQTVIDPHDTINVYHYLKGWADSLE